MNIQTLTEDEKVETLKTLNSYWQQETLNPKGITKFITATELLDCYDHFERLRVNLKLEDGSIRLMMVEKELVT